jgi:type I restriction enzyme R subunit
MTSNFTESSYENAIIELFTEELGYDYLPGPEIAREYRSVVLEDILRDRLRTINPDAHKKALDEAVRKVMNLESPNLLQNNKNFHEMLTAGVPVSYNDDGVKADHIWLVQFDETKIKDNSFIISNQFTVVDVAEKRPDIVIFINGLPLAVMELKSCSREDTDASEAYLQIRNYLQAIPALFAYNSFCVISDMVDTRAGTITANESRFMNWKTVDGSEEDRRPASFQTLFKGMFEKSRFIDIIRNFVLFLGVDQSDKQIKIIAAYHQYYAVKKAVESTIQAVKSDGKAGVFWHTQGSGKSLSMVFYSALLSKPLNNPTLVVITDRNDLDDQLFETFSTASEHLRQKPEQAASRENLKRLLDGRQAGGIIFTTMQKFEEDTDVLSDRRNIILIADEAHRSHYGLEAKVNRETGEINYGMAKYIRDALPNASFIGFTGTPIESIDRSTQEVFGNYIDIYDMTQSVEDNATRPIYYESRVMNLDLDENILSRIDAEYDKMSLEAEPYHIARSKKELGQMEAILAAEETINELCNDIVRHYEDRKHILEGKAMIVAYSRKIAMKIYNKLLDIRPGWKEQMAVVMTSGNQDPEEWFNIIGNKQHKKELGKQFKDPKSNIKIAIVVDMWLTGFDVPSLNTMYLYKPMKGHTLMQAIARVNRVYKDKEGGLIVDYAGIAAALKQAMKDYTKRDQDNYGNNDIGEAALPKFFEKLEICQDLLHGLDYSNFSSGSDLTRAQLIADGIDFVLSSDELKESFIREATALRQAETLCRSLLDEDIRIETAYFEAVRAGAAKIAGPGKFTLREINERVNELLKASIKSEGVINVFEKAPKFSIFDPEYIEMIKQMKQRNLAVEMLRKLLGDEIKVYMRSNAIKAESFSERMKKLMNQYKNGLITNAEVIEELIRMAEEMKQARDAGHDMGLL